jgi:hypothetical protein
MRPGVRRPWLPAWIAWRLAAFLLTLAASELALAQLVQAPRESAVKAAFLFKFGAFVEWPPGLFQKPDEPLVIGVSGADAVATDLEQLAAGKTVEGRPVAARRVTDNASLKGVHILFLGERPPARLREAIAAAAGPILVVTEQDGALQAGSIINFAVSNGRVRFSVSLASAEARAIRLSSRLLAVAQDIERRPR